MADTTPSESPSESQTSTHALAAPVRRPRRRNRIALAIGASVLAVTLLALVVGTQGGGSSNDFGGESAMPTGATAGSSLDVGASRTSDEEAPYSPSEDADRVAVEQTGGGAAGPSLVDVPLEDRAVVRTGSLILSTDDVATARRQVLNAIESLGGYVADEQTRADDKGGLRLTDLTLRVPTEEFDTAMERTGEVGTVTGRTQSARDVTEELVDVDTRVASAEASLRRIRLLLGRAVTLGDVIRLEQVLSSRQADLESLQAQQQSLAAKTDLATLQVTIQVPPKVTPPPTTEEATGFFAGLSRGWDALGSGYVTLATALGTAVPTVLVLALLALFARGVIRRVRRHHPAVGAAA